MKVTLETLKKYERGFTMLASTDMANHKTAYRIGRNLRKMEPDLKALEQKRIELAKKHGATVTEGVPPANQEDFQKEYEELTTLEVDVDLQPLDPKMLDGVSVKPLIYALLGDMLPNPDAA